MSKYSRYASVYIDGGLPTPLDYGVPTEWDQPLHPGMRVAARVRGQLRKGFIAKILDQPSYPRVQPLIEVMPVDEGLPPDLFKLAEWMSTYYATPLHHVLRAMVPGSIRKPVKPKQQFFAQPAKTRKELTDVCASLQNRSPAQARLIEVLLKVEKGILLTEWLERAEASRSGADALAKKGLVTLKQVTLDRSPLADAEIFPTKPKVLNPEQQEALDKIKLDQFETHLLFGVTGSGKTEVYLQAISQALEQGQGVIMLVPEIALTAQTVERFRSRFPSQIAVLHHRLSDGERIDEWRRIASGKARVVIGARSALFSPVPNLGLLIVDEEHEQSYKQSEGALSYHARDVAVMRGYISKSPVVLGSATPSFESYTNTEKGKFTLSVLHNRADTASLPKVTIVDMQRAYEKAKGYTLFSDELLTGIKARYEQGEQVLLFLNRRGYHAMRWCPTCKSAIKCPHCDLSLTFHRNLNHLSCHLCSYTLSPPPKHCPSCPGSEPLSFRGAGTEQVERALHAIFPDMRTMRIDADTTRHKGSHEKLTGAFRSGKADILIGTQMIAKGLHFPQVTLVGVLNSDTSLHIPDFRSSEYLFQILTQVAGRSGRGCVPGEVIIQTVVPDNETIQLAATQDFVSFYTKEIESRRLFNFPPWTHLIKLTCTGEDEGATLRATTHLHQLLASRLANPYETLPVAPAGYAKIKGNFRFQFLLRGPSIYHLNDQLRAARVREIVPRGVSLSIDVDPTSTYF